MPRYSIIVVHYQGTIPRETFARGISSLQRQTFRDFEILCYHDGPLLDPDAPQPVPIRATDHRFNDWGHSLRDIGIREASGDYIVHFNADNVLYPHALETIETATRRPSRLALPSGEFVDTDAMIIFPIVMHDFQQFGHQTKRLEPGSGAKMILTGNPPLIARIDCMQAVIKRGVWLAEGGWHNKHQNSDGVLYQRIGEKYGYRGIGEVLGEHF